MSETLTTTQIEAINTMPAEQRYEYFISWATDKNPVWGLSSDDGWVILSDEGDEIFPVWPAAELASQWRKGEFSDCEPQAIEQQDWQEKWLPGMANDGLLAAICPDVEGDAIIVSAEELLENLQQT